MKRQTYELTEFKKTQLRQLPPLPNVIWLFWENVAGALGLDPKSIIAGDTGFTFTALPVGHGKHWCYPSPLRCKRKPPAEAA